LLIKEEGSGAWNLHHQVTMATRLSTREREPKRQFDLLEGDGGGLVNKQGRQRKRNVKHKRKTLQKLQERREGLMLENDEFSKYRGTRYSSPTIEEVMSFCITGFCRNLILSMIHIIRAPHLPFFQVAGKFNLHKLLQEPATIFILKKAAHEIYPLSPKGVVGKVCSPKMAEKLGLIVSVLQLNFF
jgi:hypothetical protein